MLLPPRPIASSAGLRDLLDPVGLEHAQQGLQLAAVAGDLDDERIRRDVDDVRAEELDDLEDLAARSRCRRAP